MNLAIGSDPNVYPPGEDTRHLLAFLPEVRGRVVDVGTGSGLLAVAMARAGARVVATDVNPAAVRLARHNALANGVTVDVVRTNLMAGLIGPFDAVVCNPPYLQGDPPSGWIERAWIDQGTASRLLEEAPEGLAEGGRLHLLLSPDDEEAWERVARGYRVERREDVHFFFETVAAVTLRRRD